MGNYIVHIVTNLCETNGIYNLLGRRPSIKDNRQLNKNYCSIDKLKKIDKSLSYRIYSYKKNIKFKHTKSHKWAAAKLMLTKDLIRKNHQRYTCERNRNYMKTNDDIHNLKLEYKSLQIYRRKLITLLDRLSSQTKQTILKRRKKSKVPKA